MPVKADELKKYPNTKITARPEVPTFLRRVKDGWGVLTGKFSAVQFTKPPIDVLYSEIWRRRRQATLDIIFSNAPFFNCLADKDKEENEDPN